jgi:regulator of cell morphogenesis and NO signaling
MNSIADLPVGQLVAQDPGRARTFERLGIDYCCGGKQTLNEACAGLGLKLENVIPELQNPQVLDAACGCDWTHKTLAELTAHIETVHHGFLRRELPRLASLIEKVVRAHGESHPELRQVQSIFAKFKDELDFHMQKEERILFPYCRELEVAVTRPVLHCGSVRHPIDVMEAEHKDAGEAMRAFRKLTSEYSPPEGACGTYRAMLGGLAELERDMHQHVHEENNILFPRATVLEDALAPKD